MSAPKESGLEVVCEGSAEPPAREEPGDEHCKAVFAEMLSYSEQAARAGDGRIILFLMGSAAALGVVAPPWLGKLFRERLDRFNDCEVKTLDEAFGVKRPKNFNIRGARKRAKYLADVVLKVDDLRREGSTREEAISRTAIEFELKESYVLELLDYAKERWGYRFEKHAPVSPNEN